ncbi:MAG: helix-turn-helix domain-containing protein [Chromatocurvus sp.]
MKKHLSDDSNCSLAMALDAIGEWWSMLIIRDFFIGRGQRRFEQLRESLGISRNILTERLRTLVDAGVIERVPLQEGGRRCAYVLTRKGLDLGPTLVAMTQWGDRWRDCKHERVVVMRDRRTGDEIAPVSVRARDGREMKLDDLMFTAQGPAGAVELTDWPLEAHPAADAEDASGKRRARG